MLYRGIISSDRSQKSKIILASKITISTQVIKNDWVSISIKDNGLGIPKNIRERVFDPFFTTKPVGQGTGLGLSISYQIIVDKHQGKMKCISEPGKGAEFWIEIPIKQCSSVHLSLSQSNSALQFLLWSQIINKI